MLSAGRGGAEAKRDANLSALVKRWFAGARNEFHGNGLFTFAVNKRLNFGRFIGFCGCGGAGRPAFRRAADEDVCRPLAYNPR
jgi:hypothetical protein